jgi:uncharacterized protein (DUF885 family)
VKRLLWPSAAVFLSCTSTQSATSPPASGAADAAFEAFAQRFLDESLRRNPAEATTLGEHRYDGTWPDLSAEGERQTREFIAASQAELGRIDRAALGRQNAIDASILDNDLALALFRLDEVGGPHNNPVFYTRILGAGLDPLLTRDFQPHADRMRSLLGRLRGIPAVVAAAKAQLANPARVFTETAIEQNRGLARLTQSGLARDIEKEPALAADLTAAAGDAAAALSSFQGFLEKDLLARSNGDFRLGREAFQKKLRLVLEDDVDPEALVAAAREEISRTQQEMAQTAGELWPTVLPGEKLPPDDASGRKVLVRKVLNALSEDRPTNETIVPEASRLLADATDFVRQHDLVTLPPDPCRVVEMPEYKRGVAVAYCDASGPLEKHQETFVAISPTPADWKPERVQSFYREYNRSMLADLVVHEAMPGHFLQLMHANAFKSPVRSIFGNGAFVEGWAVYTEWLMAQNGFRGPKMKLERQKMLLRVAANAILDHDIHTANMSEREALDLMMNETFQEEGEAVGKWRRARVSSGQLSTYYYGYSELGKLRSRLEKVPGFNERAYHDKLLSFGKPAIRYIRELML